MSNREPKIFFIYMTASNARGVIYVGMTSDLVGRAWLHRERVIDGFTKRYWVGRLVYYEFHETIGKTAHTFPGSTLVAGNLARSSKYRKR